MREAGGGMGVLIAEGIMAIFELFAASTEKM